MIGLIVPHSRILEKIVGGGRGVVYRAEDIIDALTRVPGLCV